MIKKYLKNSLLAISLSILFIGCGANKGLEIQEFSESKYQFKSGEVINSNKVIVSKDKLAIVRGIAIGSGTGAVIGGATGNIVQGTIIGGTVGGIGGYFSGLAIDGNEAEAHEITIRKIDDLTEYKAFVSIEIPNETRVEFVVRENNKVTNIRIE